MKHTITVYFFAYLDFKPVYIFMACFYIKGVTKRHH